MIAPAVLQRCQRIYDRHREEVVLGRKTARALMDCAKAFLDFQELPPLDAYPRSVLRAREAMYRDYFEETEGLKNKPPAFAAFRVLRNERSEGYFREAGLSEEEPLVILLELHSVYFECRSQSLTSALCRLRGIDPADLAAQNRAFAEYILEAFPEDAENPLNENNPCISSVDTVVTSFVPVTEPDDDTPDTPQEDQWRKLSLCGTGDRC